MKLKLVDLIRRLQPPPKSERWEDYFHGREEILWSAAPLDTPQFHWGMVGLSLFGLPFLIAGLAVFSGGLAQLISFNGIASVGFGFFLILFSLPFIGVGSGLTIGTWVAASLRPHFVRYALSNKRAYIASSWWNHKIESYPIGPDNQIVLHQGKSDTVYFSKLTGRDSDGDKTTTQVGFEHIADGAKVYALLRDLQQKATR